MNKLRTAYSLAEMILVVMFVGILAAVAVPRINFGIVAKQKVETTAWKIVTDLRRTRRLAISDAAVNQKGYKLRLIGANPYTGYDIINLDTNKKVDSLKIDSDVICTAAGNTFEFKPTGDAVPGVTVIKVSAKGRSYTITIVTATGMIKCAED